MLYLAMNLCYSIFCILLCSILLGLNHYAHHSRHSGIPILISQLGDNHPDLPIYLRESCINLSNDGYFYIYHETKNIYCVYSYKRYDNADWSWYHKNCNNAVGPTGKYGLVGVTRYKKTGGIFKGLLNRPDKYYDCLQKGITTNEDGWDHETCLENEFDGYRLTTATVANIWGEQVDQKWNEYQADHPNTNFTAKQERLKRVHFAKQLEIGILGANNIGNWCGIFDVCHAWWSWMNYMLCFIVMLMWCVWLWSDDDVICVISCLGVEYITNQVDKYLKSNAARDASKWIEINTNGVILRTVIHGWHNSLCEAVHIAESKRLETRSKSEHNTTLLCVLIRISTLMHESFSILLTDRFEYPSGGGRPNIINKLIENVRLATYLAYHLCSKIVCDIYAQIYNTLL